MKPLSITYIHNILPYIQIKENGLILNKGYASVITDEFLKALLYSEGYENVPDWVIEAIRTYSWGLDEEKNVTVIFEVE